MGHADKPILGTLTAELERRPDGSILVRSREDIAPYPDRNIDRLQHWARCEPDRTFLAMRDRAGDWRRVSYREALETVQRIASALLARDLSAERPVAILSGNDIEHALLTLAAVTIGVPVAPISPAYALISSDFGKLRSILTLLTPGLVFVANTGPFARAIQSVCPADAEVVATNGHLDDRPVTPFSALAVHAVSSDLAMATASVGPDTIAKILFTSGSTGLPKGVINTQRMLNANQAMLTHWLPFVVDEPPVLVDWLPWNHTFGGNHNLGFVLNHGGTLYIDEGKPVPAGIAQTVRNLKEIAPTIYLNVPKGFEELLPSLREDAALRTMFFSRLRANFYAGAGLAAHVIRALDEIALAEVGRTIPMITGLGATESAPAALASTDEKAPAGNVGLPLPGLTLKLVENGGKLEARLKGPTITPGYWRNPEQTAKAYDEEGFYCLGDALKFVDPANPQAGFTFDGRVSEDFKLATGTWVSVGPLRARLVAGFAPLARDAVIAGHDRDEVMALVFPDLDGCRRALGAAASGLDDRSLLAHPGLRGLFAERLAALQKASTGSSNRVARILLLDELPSIDANEVTDKGSINQRAVLTRRAAQVEALYSEPPVAAAIRPVA